MCFRFQSTLFLAKYQKWFFSFFKAGFSFFNWSRILIRFSPLFSYCFWQFFPGIFGYCSSKLSENFRILICQLRESLLCLCCTCASVCYIKFFRHVFLIHSQHIFVPKFYSSAFTVLRTFFLARFVSCKYMVMWPVFQRPRLFQIWSELMYCNSRW